MSRKYRHGQIHHVDDLEAGDQIRREGKAHSKRRQRTQERLATDIEAHDPRAMLRLPDPTPWLHLPEATLIQRHSQWVDLELPDRTLIHATLSGKLKGVRLVVGDRVRYSNIPIESTASHSPQTQVVAVMPRRTLIKRGGIDDREPWQLVCANADELWICASVVDPPLKPGLLERVQLLALDAGIEFRIIITKRDLTSSKDSLPELEPFRHQGLAIHETSAQRGEGIETLRPLIKQATVALMGHSGVGKSTLINALCPQARLSVGDLTKYGTGRQTTTVARWLSMEQGGTLVDTPGIRTLSVRSFDRILLRQIFPEFSSEWIEDPMNVEEDLVADLEYPERFLSLQRLWQEMEERNPNQNVHR